MQESFITYRRFSDIGLAVAIATRLEEGGVTYQLEDNSRLFDPNFANNRVDSDISIKLQPADFVKADEVLSDFYRNHLDNVDDDYYLLSFTDAELGEVVAKPDEWGLFDYQLAMKLLKERGQEVKPEEARRLKQQRIKELEVPEPVHTKLIVSGYLCAFFLSFIGIFIGSCLVFYKKTLPDGRRVSAYSAKDHGHGIIILALSVTFQALWIIFRVYNGVLDFMLSNRY
jgi:hypothetical protein